MLFGFALLATACGFGQDTKGASIGAPAPQPPDRGTGTIREGPDGPDGESIGVPGEDGAPAEGTQGTPQLPDSVRNIIGDVLTLAAPPAPGDDGADAAARGANGANGRGPGQDGGDGQPAVSSGQDGADGETEAEREEISGSQQVARLVAAPEPPSATVSFPGSDPAIVIDDGRVVAPPGGDPQPAEDGADGEAQSIQGPDGRPGSGSNIRQGGGANREDSGADSTTSTETNA